MPTYESLNYRERAIVADHLGFCLDGYTTHYYDENDFDEDGNPKRKPKKGTFIKLAVEHGLAPRTQRIKYTTERCRKYVKS